MSGTPERERGPCPVSLRRCDRPACWDGCGYIGNWPPPDPDLTDTEGRLL